MLKIIKSGQYSQVFETAVCQNAIPNMHEIGVALKEEDVLQGARERAQDIIGRAKDFENNYKLKVKDKLDNQCEEIKEKSRAEGFREGFEYGKSRGYDDGYKEGYENARSEASEKLEILCSKLNSTLRSIEDIKQQTIEKYEEDIADFAWDVAKKVLCKEQTEKPEYIQDIIALILQQNKNEKWFRIHVSAEVAEMLKKNDSEFWNYIDGNMKNIIIETEADMQNSECLIETPKEVMDAGIDTQFENIKEYLI